MGDMEVYKTCVPLPMLCCYDLIFMSPRHKTSLGHRVRMNKGSAPDREQYHQEGVSVPIAGICNLFLIWGLKVNVKSGILHTTLDQIYILAKVKHSKIMSNLSMNESLK